MRGGQISRSTCALPTESELCEEFNASRFTVREALRRLVAQGMVQRRQGAGSIVVADHAAGAVRAVDVLARAICFSSRSIRTTTCMSIKPGARSNRDAAGAIGAIARASAGRLLKGLRSTEKGGKAICVHPFYVAPRAEKLSCNELRRCVGAVLCASGRAAPSEEILEASSRISSARR